jgi:hypothetical protein
VVVPDCLSFSRGGASVTSHQPAISHKFRFSPAAVSAESPVGGDFCSKLRAPHRGTSLGSFVCGANKLAEFQFFSFYITITFNTRPLPTRGTRAVCRAASEGDFALNEETRTLFWEKEQHGSGGGGSFLCLKISLLLFFKYIMGHSRCQRHPAWHSAPSVRSLAVVRPATSSVARCPRFGGCAAGALSAASSAASRSECLAARRSAARD